MATTYTTNYNLGKQENHADKFDMDVITDNADKIDAALTGLQSGIDGKQDALSSEQLAAVNSGITEEDVTQIGVNKNNISLCKAFTDNANIDSNRKLYISATEPTGDIPDGSTWIDGKTIKEYSRSNNLFNEYDIVGRVPSVLTGELVNGNGSTCTPIPITNGNITATISNLVGTENFYIFLYDENMSYIGQTSIEGNGSIYGKNITDYSNARYYRLRVNTTSTTFLQTMVNDGDTALPYEPYGGTWA